MSSSANSLTRVARAADKAASWRKERDDAIREAAKVHSLAVVAEAAGLTRARVHQIAQSPRQLA